MNNEHQVRYPVGMGKRSSCIGSIKNFDEENVIFLSYIEARKEIYLPVYHNLVKNKPQFLELKKRLEKGQNLLIVEVDGPHQDSMDYYQKKYGVDDDFIINDTIKVTEKNMEIMLNDGKHAFGHGYCLAMSLLGMEKVFNFDIPAKIDTDCPEKKEKMAISVVHSPYFDDFLYLDYKIDNYIEKNNINDFYIITNEVSSKYIEKYSKQEKIQFVCYEPNHQIVDFCDALITFASLQDENIWNIIESGRKSGKLKKVYLF